MKLNFNCRWSKEGLWWHKDKDGNKAHNIVGIECVTSGNYPNSFIIALVFFKIRISFGIRTS